MYEKLEKLTQCLLYNLHKLRNMQFWKTLFAIGFPYKHCNFWPLCLFVKMVPKTVIRSISPNMAVIKHIGHNPYTCFSWVCTFYWLLMIWVNLSVVDTIIVSRGDWLWKWAIFKAWDNMTTYTNYNTIHPTRNKFAMGSPVLRSWGYSLIKP